MAEGIVADDRLVRLHDDAGQAADQSRGLVDLRGIDAGRRVKDVGTHPQRHHDLLQGGVARALPDPVDRALHLPGAVGDRRKRIGHRQPEIIMTVHADDGSMDVGHALHHPMDQPPELLGDREADGIRDIHRRGTRLDDRLDHLVEKRRLGARGVLRGELDVAAEALGIPHGPHRLPQDFLARLAQLVLAVNRGGRQEDVDPLLLRRRKRGRRGVDIGGQRAGQGRDRRPLHGPGDHPNRLRITGRGDRESAFNDIDPQPRELLGDLHLLGGRQARPRTLFPIPQRGVENRDASRHVQTSLRLQTSDFRQQERFFTDV